MNQTFHFILLSVVEWVLVKYCMSDNGSLLHHSEPRTQNRQNMGNYAVHCFHGCLRAILDLHKSLRVSDPKLSKFPTCLWNGSKVKNTLSWRSLSSQFAVCTWASTLVLFWPGDPPYRKLLPECSYVWTPPVLSLKTDIQLDKHLQHNLLLILNPEVVYVPGLKLKLLQKLQW